MRSKSIDLERFMIPSEARPKAEPVDLFAKSSGIRTTKVKKNFEDHDSTRDKKWHFFLRLEIWEEKNKTPTIFFFSRIFQGVREQKLPTFFTNFLKRLEICGKFSRIFQGVRKKKMSVSLIFFYALKYAVKWPNFFFNLFALKNDPIFFTIFLH